MINKQTNTQTNKHTNTNTNTTQTHTKDTPPFDVPDIFPGSPQHKWFENDLKIASTKHYDWLIVFQHRPLYCSNIG